MSRRLVWDNLSMHQTPAISSGWPAIPGSACTSRQPGSSWINQVERSFGYLTAQIIRRGVHKSMQALQADIRAWIENWNASPRPFAWAKTAEEILDSLANIYCKDFRRGTS